MTIAIREMSISDRITVEQALDVLQPGWRQTAAPGGSGTIAFLADSGTFLFVAYVDDDPAGWIWGDRVRHPNGDVTSEVHGLDVAESFRRHGIASLLLEAALDLARRQNHQRFWAMSDATNAPARRLFEQLGGKTEEDGLNGYWWEL